MKFLILAKRFPWTEHLAQLESIPGAERAYEFLAGGGAIVVEAESREALELLLAETAEEPVDQLEIHPIIDAVDFLRERARVWRERAAGN